MPGTGYSDLWRRKRRLYASYRWKLLRRSVLDASGWRCYLCSSYANEVHHVDPAPERFFDASNLRPICRRDHIELERRRRGHAEQREQRQRWRDFAEQLR